MNYKIFLGDKMNLFFDEEAQKLIIEAKKEMLELKHPYVGSEHLLLAILKNTDLYVTKILNSYDIYYEVFKKELITTVGIGKKSNEWFLFTPLLKRIINNATYYSKDNNNVVTPNSLLVSILQEGDGVANRILISMNIDIMELYDRFVVVDKFNYSNKKELLNELAVNMNKTNYDPVIGREKEIEEIISILLRKNKCNPLLVGEAGVGKTAIVEELARRITIGNVPNRLKNKTIYSISMSTLVSGTKYRGEFEEKIHNLIKEIENDSNAILFIDEIHTLMGAGGAEGAIDAANIFKPYLARGDIKVIGATTSYEYKKYIEVDKAICRRFQRVNILEASRDSVKDILLKLKPIYEKYHGVFINNKIMDLLIDMSYKCVFNGKQPDKAIDLLDEVCSYSVISNSNNNLSSYEVEIKKIENEKNKEIINHNFKKALVLKNKEMNMRSEYNNKLFETTTNNKIKINKDDLYNVIYSRVNCIPKDVYIDRLNKTREVLKKSKYYSNDIIDKSINYLKKYDYIKNIDASTLLFIGKSGVGKTFLVEEIVKGIFYDINCITLNMNDYRDEHSLSKIIGTTPGYVGYEQGSLFDSIKDNPFSIILLDNIDKCNKKILDILFQAINVGYITNGRGEKINLTKCIVFMTSTSIDDSIGFVYSDVSSEDLFKSIKCVIKIEGINKKSLTLC